MRKTSDELEVGAGQLATEIRPQTSRRVDGSSSAKLNTSATMYDARILIRQDSTSSRPPFPSDSPARPSCSSRVVASPNGERRVLSRCLRGVAEG